MREDYVVAKDTCDDIASRSVTGQALHLSRLRAGGRANPPALAENLDELSDRLTPGQVFDEMLTYSRAGGGTSVTP